MRRAAHALVMLLFATTAGCDWTGADTCGRGTRSVSVPQVTCLSLTLTDTDQIVGTNQCASSLEISIGTSHLSFAAGAQISIPIDSSAWVDQGGEATAKLPATVGTTAVELIATKCLA